jgi:hypothetical protein
VVKGGEITPWSIFTTVVKLRRDFTTMMKTSRRGVAKCGAVGREKGLIVALLGPNWARSWPIVAAFDARFADPSHPNGFGAARRVD